MNIALIVAIVGAIVYLLTTALGKYTEVGELGRISFGVSLLAYLLK